MEQFKVMMKSAISSGFDSEVEDYKLTSADLERVTELKEKKYGTWEWDYGASPEYSIKRYRRFTWGKLDIRLDVQKGIISDCKIYGDFFGKEDIFCLEQLIRSIPYREEEIRSVLAGVDLSDFIGGLNRESLIELLKP
jgi:lipoate-protein ligase A